MLAPLLPASRCLWLGRGGSDEGLVPGRLCGGGDGPWKEKSYRNTFMLFCSLLAGIQIAKHVKAG